MTRAEQIEDVRARLAVAMKERKRKTATLLIARLQGLVLRQLNAEMRAERKTAA